jgi:hypothetical protein
MAWRRTGMRCNQDKPIRGVGDLGIICRPQRNHHRWPLRGHPLGTLMINALPAARKQTSRQQRRGATPPANTRAIRRSRISARSVTPESTACPTFRATSPASRLVRQKAGVGPRPKPGRSSVHSTANSGPGSASSLPTRWCPGSGTGSTTGPRRGRPAPLRVPASCRHAIGEPGAVKLKDVTARQVHKALAELPASLPARSLRPPVLTARLTRSLAHGEQLHWQPAADRRGRSLRSRVCLARPQPCLPT